MKAWRQVALVAALLAGVAGAGEVFSLEEAESVNPRDNPEGATGMGIARARTIEARPAPFPGDAQRSADALDLEWLAARRQGATRPPD